MPLRRCSREPAAPVPTAQPHSWVSPAHPAVHTMPGAAAEHWLSMPTSHPSLNGIFSIPAEL